MDLANNALDVITAFLVFLFGLVVSFSLGPFFNISRVRSLLLYLWHTVFCVLYLLYSLNNVADSTLYYKRSFSEGLTFSLGTRAVDVFVSFFSQICNLSYLGVFLVFNVLGYVGMLSVYSSLKEAAYDKSILMKRLAVLVVLLPSLSFWSSAIGKDAISFMSVGLALWASLVMPKRMPAMLLAIFLMLMVRPHMSGIMVLALALSYLVRSNIPALQRALWGGGAILGAAALIPLALNYAGVGENADVSDMAEYIEARQGQNIGGGSSLDISNMTLPVQLFSYLFRPLPFEAHSIAAFAASIDNMVLLFLFGVGGWGILKGRKGKDMRQNQVFLWVYSLLSWSILAVTTANLGIAVRQKWMFVPMLVFIFISSSRKNHRC